jgi:hypothetical protein
MNENAIDGYFLNSSRDFNIGHTQSDYLAHFQCSIAMRGCQNPLRRDQGPSAST